LKYKKTTKPLKQVYFMMPDILSKRKENKRKATQSQKQAQKKEFR